MTPTKRLHNKSVKNKLTKKKTAKIKTKTLINVKITILKQWKNIETHTLGNTHEHLPE